MNSGFDDIHKLKRIIRKKYLKMRKALQRKDIEKKSEKIITNIKKIIDDSIQSVMLYVPINNEVDLLPLARDLFLDKKTVVFPKLINFYNIEPYYIEDLYFDFKPGAYNIPEPDTKPFTREIDIALIPGIAFDREGNRIGYGKSYFDRFLRNTGIKKIVGICYHFQIVKKLPFTESDYPVHMIISEKAVINIKKKNKTGKGW
jgi:5-formyltetrahydrofolate cyclo-ligase